MKQNQELVLFNHIHFLCCSFLRSLWRAILADEDRSNLCMLSAVASIVARFVHMCELDAALCCQGVHAAAVCDRCVCRDTCDSQVMFIAHWQAKKYGSTLPAGSLLQAHYCRQPQCNCAVVLLVAD